MRDKDRQQHSRLAEIRILKMGNKKPFFSCLRLRGISGERRYKGYLKHPQYI